ncbi:hypothetical protein ACRPK2_07340 [Lactococcus garvieae]|uniref:hypothetical protein n=1 Tax=Lactococcus garvieae TaxID=1363 RepID=UPI003D77A14E
MIKKFVILFFLCPLVIVPPKKTVDINVSLKQTDSISSNSILQTTYGRDYSFTLPKKNSTYNFKKKDPVNYYKNMSKKRISQTFLELIILGIALLALS